MLSEIVFERIIFDLFEKRLDQKQQALQLVTKLPVPLKDTIYKDETFFRVGKVLWVFILLVGARGNPLVWKFSRVRIVKVCIFDISFRAVKRTVITARSRNLC